MALVIRLRQQGKNSRRSFRLVVANTRSPRDGKYIEKLGFYDPHIDGALDLDSERIKYWLEQGALISERAKILVSKQAPDVIKQYDEKQSSQKLKLLQKKKAAKKGEAKKVTEKKSETKKAEPKKTVTKKTETKKVTKSK